jgi:hypothetical protein
MALASLVDLAALGGINVDWVAGDAKEQRASRLLDLASNLVLAYLDRFGVAEADIDGWETFRQGALSAVVAEIAAKRLTVSAAASVDPYGTPVGPQTLKLNRWEKEAIRELIPGSVAPTGSASLVVDRDAASSALSYLSPAASVTDEFFEVP